MMIAIGRTKNEQKEWVPEVHVCMSLQDLEGMGHSLQGQIAGIAASLAFRELQEEPDPDDPEKKAQEIIQKASKMCAVCTRTESEQGNATLILVAHDDAMISWLKDKGILDDEHAMIVAGELALMKDEVKGQGEGDEE